MRPFLITVRTASATEQSTHFAESSAQAAVDVAAKYDQPCGITVVAGAR